MTFSNMLINLGCVPSTVATSFTLETFENLTKRQRGQRLISASEVSVVLMDIVFQNVLFVLGGEWQLMFTDVADERSVKSYIATPTGENTIFWQVYESMGVKDII